MLKKNLTRETLTNKLYQNLGLSKNISNNLVSDVFEEIMVGLVSGQDVKISSFGTFKTIRKKARIGRNPKTKIPAKIIARKIIKFKPSELLKEKINN